ncbi:uncharacterized protein LOC143582191 [Bidens hawaiensis]|uniref:uncharacterized protein LOC143582191 n=1 Tax=Bidens hawaiensis TaxID=980011 RepID=UPI00404B58E2
MADIQVVGGIKKLNHINYKKWSMYIKSYFQGTETRHPTNDINGVIGKWQVKVDRTMFIIKTMVADNALDHIQELEYPKQAWDTLESLFTKKKDDLLQLVEGDLMTCSQGDLPISQYFYEVKNLCREIAKLENSIQSLGLVARMKRILIYGLKSEYCSFVTAIQGWGTQPSITELENILAKQEALANRERSLVCRKKEKNRFNKNHNRNDE